LGGNLTITFAATSGEYHVLDFVKAGYNNTNVTDKLFYVSIGGSEVLRRYVSGFDGIEMTFNKGLYTGDSEALVIFLQGSALEGRSAYLSIGVRSTVTPTLA
jgi:hypothetical protein